MVTYWLDEILLAPLALVLWGAHDFDAIARPSRECEVAKAVLGLLNMGLRKRRPSARLSAH
jgi:hypothetical protein